MWSKIGLPWRIVIISISWLVFISFAHYRLNFDHGSKKTIYMGYMPVISNLAAPLLDYSSKEREDVRFKALKFASFSEMGESLRNGKIDAAFIIAPLSIVLKEQGEDIKVIYIGNRHESTLVTRRSAKIRSLSDLAGNKVAVPSRFSGHNITLRKLIKKQGLEGQINIVEMNPPDMAAALSSGALDAYFVGEPFAARSLVAGESDVLYYVEQIAEHFICNLMIVRNDFIKKDPETVKMLINAAARSGIWAKNHPDKTIEIAASYWNQPQDLVRYALTTPKNRILFDYYQPKMTEMQAIADDMLALNLIKTNNIDGLVDDQFAKAVNFEGINDDSRSIFINP
ncbi:MAG: ABC transporter substrate-binding protein [Methylococcaceae bacterium]